MKRSVDVWLVSGMHRQNREASVDKIGRKYPNAKVAIGRFPDTRGWKGYMIGSLRQLAPKPVRAIILVVSCPPVSLTRIPELCWVNTDTGTTIRNPPATIEDVARSMSRRNPRTSEERDQDILRSSVSARNSAARSRYTNVEEPKIPWGWVTVAVVASVGLVVLNRSGA